MKADTRRYKSKLEQSLGIQFTAWRLAMAARPERFEFSMQAATAAYHRKQLRDMAGTKLK